MKAEALSGKVLGTCTLQELIGRGGMGAVFLAQQSRPRRQVAVKVLLPIMTLQPSQRVAFLERFRRETDAAASLEHPHILPVYEYGEQDGLAYLVMPYIRGGTLRGELEYEEKLPLTQAVVYLEQMSSALDFAHQRGVIHRDVKPVNILLTVDKRLLLTDFGLVKIITDDQDGQNPLSEAGMPMGTPEYMAPEQVIGRDIDGRADLYSLAVVLYQMLTGAVPFTGEMPMKVAMQHLKIPPPPLMPLRPDLPPAAEKVILRALAKHPDDRYESTRDFTSAFRRALEGAGVVLPDVSSSTAAMNALKNGQLVHNRRRSLFDPFWCVNRPTTEGKQVSVSPQLPPGEEAKSAELTAKLSHHVAKLAHSVSTTGGPRSQRGRQKRTPSDIVAKTSMTLPSFTGLLSPIDEETPSLSVIPSDTKMSSPDTPLVDESTMNNQPENEMCQKNDLVDLSLRKDVLAGPNFPANNSLLSASRFRAGTRTNFLRDRSGIEAPTPSSPSQFCPSNVGYPTAQPNIAPPASASKLGKLLSFTQDANGNPATQSSLSSAASDLSGSAEQIDFSPQDQTATWSNFLPPTGQASEAATFNTVGMTNQNSFQPNVTGTFNNFNAQMGSTGGSFNQHNPPLGTTGVLRTVTGVLIPVSQGTTGALMVPTGTAGTGQTGMLRLTQQVKVVKVPLAGRPGQYVTGLLPVISTPDKYKSISAPAKKPLWKNLKILILVAMVILLLGGSVFFLAARFSGDKVSPTIRSIPDDSVSQQNKTATAMSQASVQANLIISDPLAANIHGWPSGTRDNGIYTFTKGAYHIKATNSSHVAIALLSTVTPSSGFVYKISMTEIDGLDASTDSNKVNRFGLVFCFSNPDDQHLSYYQFLVDPNKAKPSYIFQKYDKTNKDSPLSELWTHDIGKEYHLDHGVNNNLKITKKGSLFTFNVNGHDVGSQDDDSLSSGQVGMVVNLDGTEVAFSNLLLTKS